mmetsp:Transcript_6099/g.8901  ORF Transcript_6099/g.8901 Transcript_6099/m.8901 type:complete len:212 (+) Transcript_6099:139-774(+)|eukprot:CAMPEP_0172415790 /NCGR_PEP_ID=MMETSP1064-20121228/2234_1 /TAXON_ID=202472 /ORGANISM="Aulacoseira subarctica , Strain CCAP 1002/5" /LENGTH=211 /DNA_ID=CAMNT_0013153031 /DNA_START=59 /DNA_END=694 /DNA_ORIENTATION=+
MQFHLGILLVLYTNLAHGYVSTSFSAFTGAGSFALMTNDVRNRPRSRGTLEMKKGKSNVPINMRGNYEKQKQIKQAQEAMMAAQNPTDGKPVFNMYVKSKTGSGMWYPCGSFKGDERSAALAQSYRDGNLLSSISKNQLDSGVANAIAQDIEKFEEQLFRGLPQLRKSKGDLEYGYRLAFEGLSEEQKKMNIIVPEKREGFMEKVKGFFGQ